MKAVIFFGTPHSGSKVAGFGNVLGNIANLVLKTPGPQNPIGSFNTKLFQVLTSNSEVLQGISDDFRDVVEPLTIISCYETKKHQRTNTLVSPKEAQPFRALY